MSRCVTIEHVEILPSTRPAASLNVGRHLPPPDMVLYASSAEFGIFYKANSRQWMDSVVASHPLARHAFVSMACAGLCAAVLEFMRSTAQYAHVYLLEIPLHYVQQMLDYAGSGPEGFCLRAQEIVVCIVLSKSSLRDLRPDHVIISDCTIISKPTGANGTYALLLKMRNWLNSHVQRSTDWVAFTNAATWSHRLMSGFESLVLPSCPRLHERLPSVETDSRHWLTAKPVLEYLLYRDRMDSHPLVLITLAAGGRVGFLVVELAGRPVRQLTAVAVAAKPCLIPASPSVLSKPFWNAPEFRSHDDLYFLTELQPACPATEPILGREGVCA